MYGLVAALLLIGLKKVGMSSIQIFQTSVLKICNSSWSKVLDSIKPRPFFSRNIPVYLAIVQRCTDVYCFRKITLKSNNVHSPSLC